MDFSLYSSLFSLIDKRFGTHDRTVLAIDGGAASGKTTLSLFLSEKYSAPVVHMDDFFLPDERKTTSRMAEFDGNIDRERFLCEVVAHLSENEEFSYGKYDCHKGYITEERFIPPAKLIIVEGVYSLSSYFINAYDIKIMLTVSEEDQKRRLKMRSEPDIYNSFVTKWLPLEKKYFEIGKIADKCDLVF